MALTGLVSPLSALAYYPQYQRYQPSNYYPQQTYYYQYQQPAYYYRQQNYNYQYQQPAYYQYQTYANYMPYNASGYYINYAYPNVYNAYSW